MNIRPLGNRVVVLKDPKPDSFRGIALPAMGKQQSFYGTVLAVGPGRRIEKGDCRCVVPCELAVGDRVYLPELGGQEFTDIDPRGSIVIIEEDFIKGVIE